MADLIESVSEELKDEEAIEISIGKKLPVHRINVKS